MQAVLIVGGIAILLFLLAFKSKKRFGILGLALAGGATISEVWSYEISLIARIFKFGSNNASAVVVSAIILLLPALLLMLSSSPYKNLISRIFGSLAFSALAMAFLSKSMSQALPLDGAMKVYYLKIISLKELVIGVGLIIAILEIFFTKSHKHEGKSSKY